MSALTTPDVETLVVGAGFSGIGAGILLDRAGFGDYLLVEAGPEAGGTWYWNSYPGIGVDIPSYSYQFSFEQNPDWTRTYARGGELKRYADHCIDKYGLRSRIRFGTTVVAASFDTAANVWRIELDSGEALTARYLINGSGPLNVPKLPDIDGVDTFAGVTMHTARWDHGQDLTGKRVAIVGTGASAVQVIPEIAPAVERLTVFQRTPIWCFPKFDVPLPAAARRAARLPGAQAVQRLLSQAYVELTFPVTAQYASYFPLGRLTERMGRNYLRREVRDPQVRDKLTPRYAVGCKRPGFHNSYLSTYNRDNVELVTAPIEKITGAGVATGDGGFHDADVLILATGFKVMDVDAVPFTVTNGDGDTLSTFWEQHRMQAYEGVSIPGFPNFFTVMGPYGYVGSSYFALIEAQVGHIIRCLAEARRRGVPKVEVTAEANDRYFAEMMRKRHTQIFWQPSCGQANSYYFDSNGDVPLRRATTVEAYWRSRRFPLDDYAFIN
ncbi:monooxygenase [Mycobacterium sp. 852013-51886_SCH5428379]|uniref:flavin-containing monooxygenase n=1 Tax=Mycobacterium sp. 852013-51886_SCH5428379 TaxID=1834111 RepID=UPI000800B098|nr:NAD(P)/FAD-dependent oxidoreductase [Mycobacterium sp. 852013-51886_SCH5428379]OBB59804.1 monooxygenase [Mycobacterium sp. 852013-51886_SCH5428379]